MYFAVLQGGAEPLGKRAPEPWSRRAFAAATGVPLALALKAYGAALARIGSVRADGAEPPPPAVLCCRHEDLLTLMPARGARADWVALPRKDRVDGIARAAAALGFRVLREDFAQDGGPPPALVELVSEGNRALMSADGPARPGTIDPAPIRLAIAARAPVVPITVTGGRAASLPGGVRVFLPGGRIVIRYGDPIEVSAGGEEAATAAVHRALFER